MSQMSGRMSLTQVAVEAQQGRKHQEGTRTKASEKQRRSDAKHASVSGRDKIGSTSGCLKHFHFLNHPLDGCFTRNPSPLQSSNLTGF